MAKFDVLDMNGKKVSTVELSDAVFGITPNEKVMHAAVVNSSPISVRARRAPRRAAKCPAAAASRGARRAPAVRARALPAARSGRMAV